MQEHLGPLYMKHTATVIEKYSQKHSAQKMWESYEGLSIDGDTMSNITSWTSLAFILFPKLFSNHILEPLSWSMTLKIYENEYKLNSHSTLNADSTPSKEEEMDFHIGIHVSKCNAHSSPHQLLWVLTVYSISRQIKDWIHQRKVMYDFVWNMGNVSADAHEKAYGISAGCSAINEKLSS